MKRYGMLIAVPLVLLTGSSAIAQEGQAMQAAPAMDVAEIVITSEVMDRVPADTLQQVSAQAGVVYCWTRIVGAEGDTSVEHVWYRTDEEMARVSLNVGGSDWRTWSSKRIQPDWAGSWRVDVVASDGTVLQSVNFQVTE